MIPNNIKELQTLVNEMLILMSECDKKENREYYFGEYRRLKADLDNKMNEYAEGLVNFDII